MITKRPLYATLVSITLFLASCSACPRGEHVPRLAEADVISIANDAARKSGTDLSKFRAPEAHFQYVDKNCTWSVFYEGVGSTMGNHFLIIVDDTSRRTQVFGGL